MSVLYTILGIVVVLVIWGVFAYNSLVQQKKWVAEGSMGTNRCSIATS